MSESDQALAMPEEILEPQATDSDGRIRNVSEMQKESANKMAEIRDQFDLLLNQRDQQINDLEQKLNQKSKMKLAARMLVLDDAQSTVEILNRYLHVLPIEVVHARGDQAQSQLSAGDYAAIMIEAALQVTSDVNGMALCRQLCEAGKGGLIIVMSSRPGDKVKKAAEQAGVFFLPKPFRCEQTVKLIRDILQWK